MITTTPINSTCPVCGMVVDPAAGTLEARDDARNRAVIIGACGRRHLELVSVDLPRYLPAARIDAMSPAASA